MPAAELVTPPSVAPSLTDPPTPVTPPATDNSVVTTETAGVTLARPVKKEDGWLDWTLPAPALERRTRAFAPWPGAWTSLRGTLLKVHRARVGGGRGAPGEVVSVGKALEVACGQGSLVLLEVQAQGKRRHSAAEFLRGHPLAVASRPFDPLPERTTTP